MTLKRLSLLILGLCVSLAAAVAGVWYVRYLPYSRLLDDGGDLIVAARRSPEIKVSSVNQVPADLPDGPTQVVVRTNDRDIVQKRYYRMRQLAIVDIHGGDSLVVRRDIFDDERRLRIRVYFGTRGEVVLMQYLDEFGALLARVPLLLPFGGRGTIY